MNPEAAPPGEEPGGTVLRVMLAQAIREGATGIVFGTPCDDGLERMPCAERPAQPFEDGVRASMEDMIRDAERQLEVEPGEGGATDVTLTLEANYHFALMLFPG